MKQKLDERQIYIKNKIGSQSFFLLAYLLFIDAGLYGFGILWLPYPANIIVILMACLFLYLVRLIRASSYAPPGQASKKPYLVIAAIGTAIVAAAIILLLVGQPDGIRAVSEGNDALAIFIIGAVMLAVIGIVVFVRKKQDKDL